MTTIRLPYPPSGNSRLTRLRNGRLGLTETYRAWKREAALEIMAQRARPVAGEVAVRVELVAPDGRRRDADNTLKSVIDALVAGRIIEDDDSRFVRSVTVEWMDAGDPCVVRVTPHRRAGC